MQKFKFFISKPLVELIEK
jgi:hypothetical protein